MIADPKEVARLALELTDRQDWPGRERLMAADAEFVTPAATTIGPEAATAFSRPMSAAFPDGRHVLDTVAVAGDRVVVEGTWVATHTGPLATPQGEVPATGRPIRLSFACIFHVPDGLIASMHAYWDQLSFLAQVGLVPAPLAA